MAVAQVLNAVLIPAFQILKPIIELIAAILKPVVEAISTVARIGGNFLGGALSRIAGTPSSPNTGVIQSNTTTTSRSSLDVNFNNAPQGTTMRQTGRAPGITVNPFNTLRAFN